MKTRVIQDDSHGEMSAAGPETALTSIGRMAGLLGMAAALVIVVEQLLGVARLADGVPGG